MTPAPTGESQKCVQQLCVAGKNGLNISRFFFCGGIPGARSGVGARMRARSGSGSGARGFGGPGAGA